MQGKTTQAWQLALLFWGLCADREQACVSARMSELQITAPGRPGLCACSCRAKPRGSVVGVAVTLPDLLKLGVEPARPRAEVELGVCPKLPGLQQTKAGRGPAPKGLCPPQDPWGSVHMAVAAWLGCAVPGGFGKGVQAVTEQPGCNWYSPAPKAPCFSHRRPGGTLQPSKPSTLPPASALRSPACVFQLWSQS